MTSSNKKRKSISTYVLMFLMLFQSISAIPSAVIMIYDPSGKTLGLPIGMLQYSPFNNFLIPGLFLLIVLGVFPVITLFGLIKRNEFSLATQINLYKDYHWSWTFSFYVGLLLVLWINMQLFFIRGYSVLHFVYSMLGAAIIMTTHLPRTREDYRINNK